MVPLHSYPGKSQSHSPPHLRKQYQCFRIPHILPRRPPSVRPNWIYRISWRENWQRGIRSEGMKRLLAQKWWIHRECWFGTIVRQSIARLLNRSLMHLLLILAWFGSHIDRERTCDYHTLICKAQFCHLTWIIERTLFCDALGPTLSSLVFEICAKSHS